MPRPVTEPNTFGQLSGTVSASLLDQNFSALTAITNDSAAGWVNAAVDTGSANQYVVTLNPPAAEYIDGFFLAFIPLNANTGPSSINVNGLGNLPILKADGSSLTSQTLNPFNIYSMICIARAFRIIAPSTSVIVGEVQMFAGATPPANWLFCNGAAVSRTQYRALFQTIGGIYGAGDGATTFNVPNMIGRFPSGATPGVNLGGSGGSNQFALTTANLPPHTHPWIENGHTHNYVTGQGTAFGVQAGGSTIFLPGAAVTGSNNQVVGSVGATGSGTPVAFNPPFLLLNYIIRAY